MEFLKGLIKWIVLAIVIIILILLIVKFSNKAEQKVENTEPSIKVVEKDKDDQTLLDSSNDTTLDESLVAPREDLVVDSPDTASSGIMEMLLGITIISFGGYYIYKHRNVTEENA